MTAAIVVTIFFIALVALSVWLTWGKRQSVELVRRDPGEFERARLAYEQAQRNFDLADPQFIDIAISDLGISENRVNNEICKLRMGR